MDFRQCFGPALFVCLLCAAAPTLHRVLRYLDDENRAVVQLSADRMVTTLNDDFFANYVARWKQMRKVNQLNIPDEMNKIVQLGPAQNPHYLLFAGDKRILEQVLQMKQRAEQMGYYGNQQYLGSREQIAQQLDEIHRTRMGEFGRAIALPQKDVAQGVYRLVSAKTGDSHDVHVGLDPTTHASHREFFVTDPIQRNVHLRGYQPRQMLQHPMHQKFIAHQDPNRDWREQLVHVPWEQSERERIQLYNEAAEYAATQHGSPVSRSHDFVEFRPGSTLGAGAFHQVLREGRHWNEEERALLGGRGKQIPLDQVAREMDRLSFLGDVPEAERTQQQRGLFHSLGLGGTSAPSAGGEPAQPGPSGSQQVQQTFSQSHPSKRRDRSRSRSRSPGPKKPYIDRSQLRFPWQG